MSVVFRESSERALMSRLDIGLISLRDRACLRLLYRAGVATAQQLATLVYPSRRTALRRLRRLWQLGLLERAPLAPERGGIPVVYRITRRGSKRLGYTDTRTGGVTSPSRTAAPGTAARKAYTHLAFLGRPAADGAGAERDGWGGARDACSWCAGTGDYVHGAQSADDLVLSMLIRPTVTSRSGGQLP